MSKKSTVIPTVLKRVLITKLDSDISLYLNVHLNDHTLAILLNAIRDNPAKLQRLCQIANSSEIALLSAIHTNTF